VADKNTVKVLDIVSILKAFNESCKESHQRKPSI
jgi:hypothetical protein